MLKFLALIILIFGSCSALLHPPDDSPSKLTKLICDVSEEVPKEESRTMAMIKLQNSFPPRFFDDLHQCMPTDISMVQVDIESAIDNEKLKDAKFVVVIGDKIDASLMINLTSDLPANPILRHTAKFLFVSSCRHPRTEKISELFAKNGILNFAFAYEDDNGEIFVEISNHFAKSSQILKDTAKLSELYPNKLANMHQMPLRAIVSSQMQYVKIQNGKVSSIHKYLWEEIADKLNATLQIRILSSEGFFAIAEGRVLMENKEVDMTLSDIPDPKHFLVSYIETGACALIPPSTASYSHSLFLFETFKNSTTLALFLTLGCAVILWRLFKAFGQTHGSSWNIAFGIMASLFGQSFTIKTANFMLYSLIILNIYGTIILSNLYQATLTSEITMSEKPHQIKTFAELFESNHDFHVGLLVVDSLETVPEYHKAVERGRVTVEFMTSIEHPEKVTITRCDRVVDFLASSKGEAHYMLPEKVYTSPSFHEMGYTNPYTDTFQVLINWAYSGGLNQAWETFEGRKKIVPHAEEESSQLTFKDLLRVFRIFPFLYAAAILVFVMEIVYAKIGRAIMRRIRRNRVQPML